MVMKYIEKLYLSDISVFDKNYLNKLIPRDGFQFILDDDFDNMCNFIKQYHEDYGDIIPILTDNNGNYICISNQENNKGTIVLLSHDEGGLIGLFKNVPSLVDSVNNNTNYWDIYDFPKELLNY
jgi:hypothetical protein